jgi:hypothetical protein
MRKVLLYILIGSALVLPHTGFAQIDPHLIPESGGSADCDFVTGEFDFECIPLYVAYVIQVMFSFIGTICLIQIIYGGYQIMIGNLTDDKESGKKRIRSAIFGLAVSLLSFLIIDMIIGAVIP